MTDGAEVCHKSNTTEKINLLILVDSLADNFQQRKRIRDTWCKYWVSRVTSVRVVFFLGKPQSTVMKNEVTAENSIHNDIVWSNIKDLPALYGSIKALSWMQWLMTKCKNANMVLKVDENVILNVPAMLKFVKTNHKAVNTIWGFEEQNESP
jgi:hypothetical protein